MPHPRYHHHRAHPYDYGDAVDMLTHLDTMLDQRNPGASSVLRAHDVDIIDCAFKLSRVVPHLISVEFNPSASKNMIAASIQVHGYTYTRLCAACRFAGNAAMRFSCSFRIWLITG